MTQTQFNASPRQQRPLTARSTFLVFIFGCCASCFLPTVAASRKAESDKNVSILQTIKFEHVLRVCNAYPSKESLHVYHGSECLTDAKPLNYMSCREFNPTLTAGDKLEARINNAIFVGAFVLSELPQANAVLVLVVHRQNTETKAVAFSSHVFADMLSAQVAVVDTYKGILGANGSVRITPYGQNIANAEELTPNSVVAVNQGAYEVGLFSSTGSLKLQKSFVALSGESYVFVRAGVEDAHKFEDNFPDDVIVFPISDAGKLKSSAAVVKPSQQIVYFTILALSLMIWA